MANLSAAYNSSITNQRAQTAFVVAAGQTFYEGGLVQLNDAGKIIPADATSANKIVGQFVRLSPDGLTAEVREGDITLANALDDDACTQANVGAAVYASDDHTVSKNQSDGGSPPNNRPKAGLLVGFTASGNPIVRCTLETT
jgi:hypothetical protein